MRLQEEDKDFYQELTTVIERNISDPDLDVNFYVKKWDIAGHDFIKRLMMLSECQLNNM